MVAAPVGLRGRWGRSARQETDVSEPGPLIRRSGPGSMAFSAPYTAAVMSERSERINVAGSPRSGEQLTGAPPVDSPVHPHAAMVHQ
jgi:hypothetical protein